MLTGIGFSDVTVGPPVDTFGGAHGEPNARAFDVNGHGFVARKPPASRPGDESLRTSEGAPAD